MTPFDITAAIRIVDPYGHDEGVDLATRLGIGDDAMRRAKHRGYLSLEMAERIAHHIGWHIGDIWPAYWEWMLARADESDRLEATRTERHNARQRVYQAKARAARRAA